MIYTGFTRLMTVAVTAIIYDDDLGTCHLPECGQGLLELIGVKLPVSVEVHSSKDDFEGSQTNAAFLLDGELESQVELTDHNVLVHTVKGHSSESKYFLYLATRPAF